MIRVCATSDFHGYLPQIHDCDLLCICGDIVPLYIQSSNKKSKFWLENDFSDWIESIPCDKVILIAGNHDLYMEYCMLNDINVPFSDKVKDKLIYLYNSEYIYKGLKIYGTPACKEFYNWAFMYSSEKLKEIYSHIPENCDILMTHDAPKLCNLGLIQEPPQEGVNAGNSWLADEIFRKHPRYTFCGHIHSGEHALVEFDDMQMANVSYVNEGYVPIFDPLYLNLENEK